MLSSCLEQMTPHWDGTRQLGGADDADDNEVPDDADADNNDNEDADDCSADTDDWSPVLMMLILMTMLMLLMARMALDDSGSLFLSPLPHLRETARIRRLVCFSQTCLLFVFREEGGVEFLLHYLPKWRGGGMMIQVRR